MSRGGNLPRGGLSRHGFSSRGLPDHGFCSRGFPFPGPALAAARLVAPRLLFTRFTGPRFLFTGLLVPRLAGGKRPIARLERTAAWFERSLFAASGRSERLLASRLERLPARRCEGSGAARALTLRIALAPVVTLGAPFLIALLFLVAGMLSRILVLAAGSPVAAAHVSFASRRRAHIPRAPRRTLGIRRFPQLPAREPLQPHILVRALQLIERGQQLLMIARAKRGRLAVDQNRPVRKARRHRVILPGRP